MLPDKMVIMTVTCSACRKKFQHVELGKKLMTCPKCKRDYVLLDDGCWHDKRFQEFLENERKSKKA